MVNQNVTPPQALLFDMDGTLLLSNEKASQSWYLVCEQFAQEANLAPQTLSQTLDEIYRSYQEAIAHHPEKQQRDRLDPFTVRRERVEEALARCSKKERPLATAMVHAYEQRRDYCRQLAPHARETLTKLRQAQIPLALLTNGNASYQRRKIAQHHLASFFDCILIEEEFRSSKSDQRIYAAALDQLGTPAHLAWMVGDDLFFDISVPQQLGIFTLWFDPHHKGLSGEAAVHPDRIIHALPELSLS